MTNPKTRATLEAALSAYWEVEDPDRAARRPMVEQVLAACAEDPALWRSHRDKLARTLIDFGDQTSDAAALEALVAGLQMALAGTERAQDSIAWGRLHLHRAKATRFTLTCLRN